MKIILFGATGMVGQGVLRESLLDPDVMEVLSIVRSASGQRSPKLRELVCANFFDFSAIARELSGFDTCFFLPGCVIGGFDRGRVSAGNLRHHDGSGADPG
jgi:putative NADH-flavin reductase